MRNKRTIFAFAMVTTFLLHLLPSVFAALEIERPYRNMEIPEGLYNRNTDNNGSLALGTAITGYSINASHGGDCVGLNVSAMANTRKLTYSAQDVGYRWIDESQLSNSKMIVTNVGEDWGAWLNLSLFWSTLDDFRFKFYHANYRSVREEGTWCCVWICSNGFISFDTSEYKGGEPMQPPKAAAPNALIAPLWTHLVVDDQASIIAGTRWVSGQRFEFVVTWKNVLVKDTDKRLTFQLILEEYTPDQEVGTTPSNGRIYFSYQHVESVPIGGWFAYGIENHDGSLGIGFKDMLFWLGELNGTTMQFEAEDYYHFVNNLYLEFEDSNLNTRCYIPDGCVRGHNLKTKPSAQPSTDNGWLGILRGTGQCLMGACGYLLYCHELIPSPTPITLLVSAGLIAWDLYQQFTKVQYNSIDAPERKDYDNTPVHARASIKVPVNQSFTQDATLDIAFEWVLDDASRNENHSLTIKSTVEYGYASYSWNLTTTLNIKIFADIGKNSPDSAEEVHEGTYQWLYIDYTNDNLEYYKIYVPYFKRITVNMTNMTPGRNFNLYLYENDIGHLVCKSENGPDETELVTGVESHSSGCWWYIQVKAASAEGFYNMSISIQQFINHQPNTPSKPSGSASAYVLKLYNYSTETTDPDGDNVVYTFSWGDDSDDTETDWTASGVVANASHPWFRPGKYNVTVQAKDYYGATSAWSLPLSVDLTQNDANSGDDAGNSSAKALFINPGAYYGTLYITDDEDWYNFSVTSGQGIDTLLTMSIPWTNFDLEIYNPSGTRAAYSNNTGSTDERIIYDADSTGNWSIKINRTRSEGQYRLTLTIYPPGGGDDPCPTLFVWNGTTYVDYGVINIHNPSGEDVVREVSISRHDVAITNYQAYFRLREGWLGLNFSESVIDQVKLYAVDSYGNRYLCPLINAVHSRLGNVLLKLLFSDDYRVQMLLLETIDLKFFVPYQNIQSYVFVIEGCNMLKE